MHVDDSWVGSTPRSPVPAFIGLAAQAKLVRFVSAGASALHTLLFGFNPGEATGTQGIGACSAESFLYVSRCSIYYPTLLFIKQPVYHAVGHFSHARVETHVKRRSCTRFCLNTVPLCFSIGDIG